MGDDGLYIKDKKIILELDNDARQSNSQIAKKVGLTKQVVNYRLNKLVKEGVIKSFRTIINAEMLGFNYHDIFIKRQNFSKQKEKEFTDYIKNCDFVSWFVESSGQYDYIIAIFSRNLIQFNNYLSEILAKFEDFIADYEILTIIEAYKLKYKYLTDEQLEFPKPVYAGKVEEEKPDIDVNNEDLQILNLLDQDARMPITEIASKTQLTPSIISYRIKKMKQAGIIQGFRTILDVSKMGYQWHVILFKLNPLSPIKIKQLITYLRDHKHCVYIVQGISSWNLMTDFHIKEATELDNILEDIRSKYGDLIKAYTTLRIPNVYKSIFFPKLAMTVR